MPPLTQRKRLTNEEKLNIIEDSKKPGFCRKKTQVTFSESWGHIRNYSCLLLSKYVRSSSPSFSRNSGSLVIVDIFQLTEQSTITRGHCTFIHNSSWLSKLSKHSYVSFVHLHSTAVRVHRVRVHTKLTVLI